jgi:LacI family transcriptional regulator
LTAVDQPIAATTAKAVELIIAARNAEPAPAGLTIVPATIVERSSVAPPPGHAGG